MSDNKALQQLVKGSGLLFIGTVLVYIIKFIYRIIVSRYLGPSDYGLLSLGDGVLNIAFLFALLGLNSGIIKFISHNFGNNRLDKVKGTIIAVLSLVVPFSIIILFLIIIFSKHIAIGLFGEEKLIPILIIFALAIPFYALSNILGNIFIAFKKVHYRNYLAAIVRPLSYLFFITLIIFLKGNIYFIALACLLSHIFPVILGIYLLEFKTFSIIRSKIKAIYQYKRIIFFSLPLFYSGVFVIIMGWADTFFLGALKTISEVGIYNVVLPLVSTLTIFASSFGNIFFPISSELYAKKEYTKITRTYSSITRWTFLLGFPVFLFILTFPEDVLRILFGTAYESGALALKILITTYFLKTIIGPASETLITFNKTKILFVISSIATIINFVLNYVLISNYGLIGAAMATSISIFFRDGTIFLIARKKIHFKYSFSLLFKYAASAIIPLTILFILVRDYFTLTTSALILSILGYGFIYLGFLVIFRSFTEEDMGIIEALEKKLKINLNFLKKMMTR